MFEARFNGRYRTKVAAMCGQIMSCLAMVPAFVRSRKCNLFWLCALVLLMAACDFRYLLSLQSMNRIDSCRRHAKISRSTQWYDTYTCFPCLLLRLKISLHLHALHERPLQRERHTHTHTLMTVWSDLRHLQVWEIAWACLLMKLEATAWKQ